MVTQGLLATDLSGIHSDTVLRDIPGAVMQPEEWQSRSKQSHLVEDGAEAQLAKIRNDLGMMRPDLEFRSIAVGNASPERRECRVPNIRHASAPFSTGVQEGLHHHGWLPEQATCNWDRHFNNEGLWR